MELTPELIAKREAIIIDGIKQINTTNVDTNRQGYISPPTSEMYDKMSADTSLAQPQIDEIQSKCKVCMLGLMLISYIRLHGRLTVGQMFNSTGTGSNSPLQQFFSEEELYAIECRFEMWDHVLSRSTPSKERMLGIYTSMLENGTILPRR